MDAELTTTAAIDAAFRRLMRMRIRLGMLDPPGMMPQYTQLGKADLRTAEATALNRQAAAAGMVLLQNGRWKGKPLLPLQAGQLKGKPGSVLVSGPDAIDGNNTLGNYACNPANCSSNLTTVLGGLTHAGSGLTNAEVVYVETCTYHLRNIRSMLITTPLTEIYYVFGYRY